jgi:hypothetical protein
MCIEVVLVENTFVFCNPEWRVRRGDTGVDRSQTFRSSDWPEKKNDNDNTQMLMNLCKMVPSMFRHRDYVA